MKSVSDSRKRLQVTMQKDDLGIGGFGKKMYFLIWSILLLLLFLITLILKDIVTLVETNAQCRLLVILGELYNYENPNHHEQ